jgi:LysM repeat protein
MRVRTRSACVVLAWGILLIITAVGPTGPLRPAQANTRIASSTTNTTTITTQATLAGSATSTPDTQAGTGAYVVQPGDTLAGIAAALSVHGGWPALYAANRRAIGPDPNQIRAGTALALPGRAAPARYTVKAGDTLSGIASALGTRGGWPALYAANRPAIGPDPNQIRAGTALAIPRPTSTSPHPAPSASPIPRPGHRPSQPSSPRPAPATTPASAPAATPASARPATRTQGQRHGRQSQAHPSAIAGLPRWLEIVLLAAGLLIGTAFLTEPTLAIARRRRSARPGAAGARIVLADYDRLVVTHCNKDGTVCVLRPPGSDPQAILLAARLVLAQDRYEELAGHLGVPAHWPRE